KRHQIVLVASCAVQHEQQDLARIRARFVQVDERVDHAPGSAKADVWTASGGRTLSMAARVASSHGGSTSVSPRCAACSSTAKPGPSVASSKSTPPGSRK